MDAPVARAQDRVQTSAEVFNDALADAMGSQRSLERTSTLPAMPQLPARSVPSVTGEPEFGTGTPVRTAGSSPEAMSVDGEEKDEEEKEPEEEKETESLEDAIGAAVQAELDKIRTETPEQAGERAANAIIFIELNTDGKKGSTPIPTIAGVYLVELLRSASILLPLMNSSWVENSKAWKKNKFTITTRVFKLGEAGNMNSRFDTLHGNRDCGLYAKKLAWRFGVKGMEPSVRFDMEKAFKAKLRHMGLHLDVDNHNEFVYCEKADGIDKLRDAMKETMDEFKEKVRAEATADHRVLQALADEDPERAIVKLQEMKSRSSAAGLNAEQQFDDLRASVDAVRAELAVMKTELQILKTSVNTLIAAQATSTHSLTEDIAKLVRGLVHHRQQAPGHQQQSEGAGVCQVIVLPENQLRPGLSQRKSTSLGRYSCSHLGARFLRCEQRAPVVKLSSRDGASVRDSRRSSRYRGSFSDRAAIRSLWTNASVLELAETELAGPKLRSDNLTPMILLLVLMALSLAGGGIGLDAAEHDAAIGSFLRERSPWQPMCLYTFDDPDIGSTIANRVPGGACPFEALQPDNQLVSSLNTATSFWQLGVHLAEAPNNDTTRVQLSSVSSVSAREFFTVSAVRNDSVSGSGVTFEMVIRRRAKSNQSMTLFSIANEYDNCVDAGFRLDLNEHQVLAFIYFVPVLEDGGEAGVEACYEQRLFSVDTSAACQLPQLLEPVERTPAVQITVTLDPSSDRGHWKTDFYMSYTDAETMKRVDCVVHDEQQPPNAQVLNNLIEGRYKLYLGNSPRNVSSPRKRKRLAPVREFQLLGNSSGLNATERLRAMLKQKLMSISGPRLPKAMRIFGDNSLSLKILGITFPPLNEDTPLAYLRSKMTDFKEQYGDRIVDYLVDLVQKKASKTVVGQRNGDTLTPAGQNIDMGSAFSRSALYQGAGGATFDLFHFAIYRRVVTEEQVNSITRQLLLPSRQFPSSQQTVRTPEDSLVLLNLTMLHGVFDDLRLELRGLPEFGRLLLFPNQTVVTASNLNVFRELPLEYQHHIFFRPEPDQNNENLPLPNPVAFSRRLQPYATVRFGVADSLAGRVVNRSAEARIDVFVDAVNDAPRPRNSELETPVRVGVPVILNLEGDDIDGAPAASSADGEVSDASGFLSSFSFTNAANSSTHHQLLKIVRMPKFGKLFDCNTTCDTMRFAEEHELESTHVYRHSVDTKTANLSTTLMYIYCGWGRKNLGASETGLVVDELWYRLSDGDPGIFSDVGVVRFVLVGGTSTADGNVLATIRVDEDSIRVLDLGELDPLTPFFNSRTRFELTVLPRHGNLFQLNDVNESGTAATAENATGCVSRERIGARIKTTGTIVSDPFGRVIYVPKLDYSSLDPRFPFVRDDDGDFFEYKVFSTPANKDSLVVHAKSPAALFTNGSVARRVRLEVVNVPDDLVVLPPFAFTANSSSLDTVPAPVTFEDPDSINSDQLYQVNVEAADGTSAIALGFAITDDDVMAECPYERPCVLIWSTNGTRLTTSSNNTRDSELSFHITTQLFDPSHIEVTGTVAALNTALAALSIRDLSGVSSNVAHTSGFKLWVKRLGAGVEDEATTATFTIKFPGDATSVSSSSGNLVSALNSQLERYVSTLLFLLAGWVVLSNGSCISFGFCCCCCSRARKKRRRKFEQEQRRFREQVAQNDYEYSVLLTSLADMVLQPDLLVSVCLLKSCVRSTDRVKETEVLMQAFVLRSLLPVLESERQGARFVFKLMALEHSEGIASVQGSGSIFQRQAFLAQHSAASMALASFCRLVGSKWMSELLSRGDAKQLCSVDIIVELETLLDKLTQRIAALPVEIVILCQACAKLFSGEDGNQSREMELDAVHLVFFNHFLGPALLFPRECVPGFHPSIGQGKAMRAVAFRIAEFAGEWGTCGKRDDVRSRSCSTDSLLGTFSAELEAIAACQRKYEQAMETISWSSTVASSYDPSEPKSDVDCEFMGMCLMNVHSLLDSDFHEFKRTLHTQTNSEQTDATITRMTRLLKALSYPLASIDELVEYARSELMKDPLLWNDFSFHGWHNRVESERHHRHRHRHQIQRLGDENPQSLLAEHFSDDSDFILEEEDKSPREVDWLNT